MIKTTLVTLAIAADTVFHFASGGVSEFEVLGIDPNLGLDPRQETKRALIDAAL
jgi:hypothetical protein